MTDQPQWLRIDTHCASGPGGRVTTSVKTVELISTVANKWLVVQSQIAFSDSEPRGLYADAFVPPLTRWMERQQAEQGAERLSQITMAHA